MEDLENLPGLFSRTGNEVNSMKDIKFDNLIKKMVYTTLAQFMSM